jgi:hypothetical protein
VTAEGLHDPAKLERDVARAHVALGKWRVALQKDPEAHAEDEPLEPFRHVAGRTAYEAARALGPIGEGLARWIAHLTQARITRDLDAALAKETHDKAARYALLPGRRVSYAEAKRGVVGAPTRAEAIAWLDAAAERGPKIVAILRERGARRDEVARRLGLEDPWSLATRVPRRALEEGADELLRTTRDLARAVRADAAKHEPVDRPSPVDAMRIAIARDAPEGWPARLSVRWIVDTFPRVSEGLRLDFPAAALPEILGASSFARALAAFGRALRQAGAAPSLPFSLARDPASTDAHRFANLFAHVAATRAFQKRVLGNGERVAANQARALSRTLLAEARLDAARALLGRAPDRAEELGHDVFGAPMPPALASAWPAVRDDEGARAQALLTTLPFARELVDRFDVDWFRNPRAAVFLRARASAPAWDDTAEIDAMAAARALARALEEELA